MKNIFVGNLDFNTTEDDLRQLFSPYGAVDRVSIMTDRDTGRSRGFGFVEMANTEEGEAAIAALNGINLEGGVSMSTKPGPKRSVAEGGVGRPRVEIEDVIGSTLTIDPY